MLLGTEISWKGSFLFQDHGYHLVQGVRWGKRLQPRINHSTAGDGIIQNFDKEWLRQPFSRTLPPPLTLYWASLTVALPGSWMPPRWGTNESQAQEKIFSQSLGKNPSSKLSHTLFRRRWRPCSWVLATRTTAPTSPSKPRYSSHLRCWWWWQGRTWSSHPFPHSGVPLWELALWFQMQPHPTWGGALHEVMKQSFANQSELS